RRRSALRDRARPPGRARGHARGRRAGRHDHPQRARAGCRRTRPRRRRLGRRSPRCRVGVQRCPPAREGPGVRRVSGGDRGYAHKRGRAFLAALNRASILLGRVSDKHAKHESKYTLDRKIPGAFEGETITRRRFMVGGANAAGVIAAAAFTLPALGVAIGPIFKSTPHPWETVGRGDSFPDNNDNPVTLTLQQGIGEAGKTTAYIRKFNPAIDTDPYDRGTQFIAISSRCAHLGCPVRWVDAAERFICPCHGGVYDLLGRRVGGPPPRPLDRFYTR